MKEVAELLAPYFVELFNRSFATGQFPSTFKEAFITPIVKKPGLDIHLYSPERQQQQVKKAPNTQQKQTNKRERKNYAQIGQASEQCYHQRTLKTSVNQR